MNNNKIGQKIWKDYILREILFTSEKKGVYKVSDNYNNLSVLKVYKVSLFSIVDEESTSGVDFINHLNKVKDYLLNSIENINKLSEIAPILKYDDYAIRLDKKSLGFNVYLKYRYLPYIFDYFKERVFTYDDLMKFSIKSCEALVKMEEINIVHRNLSFDKVFVTEQDEFVVGNFGLFYNYDIFPKNREKLKYELKYPPEKCNGGNITKKSDIYSLGVIIYYFLYNGSFPIMPVKTPESIMTMIDVFISQKLNEFNINSNIKKSLLKIMLKALAYKENDRYQNAKEMLNDLKYLYSEISEDEKEIVISKNEKLKQKNKEEIKNKKEFIGFNFEDDLELTKNFDIPKEDLANLDATMKQKEFYNKIDKNPKKGSKLEKEDIDNEKDKFKNKETKEEKDYSNTVILGKNLDEKDYEATVVLDKVKNSDRKDFEVDIENVNDFLHEEEDIDIKLDEIDDLLKDIDDESVESDSKQKTDDILKSDNDNQDEKLAAKLDDDIDIRFSNNETLENVQEESKTSLDVENIDKMIDDIENFEDENKHHKNMFDESNYFHSPDTLKKEVNKKDKNKENENINNNISLVDENTGKINFLNSKDAGTVDEGVSNKVNNFIESNKESKFKKEKKYVDSKLYDDLKLSDDEEIVDIKVFETTVKHDLFFKDGLKQNPPKNLENNNKENLKTIKNKFSQKKFNDSKVEKPKVKKSERRNNFFKKDKEAELTKSNIERLKEKRDETIKILSTRENRKNNRKSNGNLLAVFGIVIEGLILVALIAMLVIFSDKIFLSEKLVKNYDELKFSSILESEDKTYRTESKDSVSLDNLYYLKKPGNYSKKITSLSCDNYLNTLFEDGSLYAKAIESDENLIYIDKDVNYSRSMGEWIIYLKNDGKLYIKPEGIESEIQLIGEDIESFDIAKNRIVALKKDRKLVVKDGSWEEDWIEIAEKVIKKEGSSNFSVSDNRISYINENKVLYIKEGAANSKWKEISKDVYSCRLTNNRIAYQNYKYELYLLEGDLNGKASKISDEVGSFRINDNGIIYLNGKNDDGDGYDLMLRSGGESAKWEKVESNVLQAILEEDILVILTSDYKLKISNELDSKFEYETKGFTKCTPTRDDRILILYNDMTLFLSNEDLNSWKKINVNY